MHKDTHSAAGPEMSQSEVEALLAQVETSEAMAPDESLGDRKTKPNPLVKTYQFPKASVLAASEVRNLRLRHDEFITSLAARLSTYLRIDFHLQMSKLETTSFKQFVDNLVDPTHIALFRLDPLEGICLLEIPARLALAITDRRMGGPGACNETPRNLTPIEVGLLEQPGDVILSELCGVWNGMLDLRAVLLGHETNGRFLQTSRHDTTMLIVAMEARFGEITEQLQIGIPFCTLKPLVEKLNAAVLTDTKPAAGPASVLSRWNRSCDDLQLRITVEWSHLEMKAKDLARLRVGDVIPLRATMPREVNLCLEKKPKFIGELGTCGESWAVRIVSQVSELTSGRNYHKDAVKQIEDL